MVMTDDLRNFGISLYLSKDPLTDDRVLFHLQTLVVSQGAGLFQQAGGKSNLADVVHKSREVS